MIKSINVVVDDLGVTMMIESEDNNVYEHWGSYKANTPNEELSPIISPVKPFKATKNVSLLKWEKGAHFVNNIIGDVERAIKTRHQIQEMLNYICYTSSILPKNIKEALQDVHWVNSI